MRRTLFAGGLLLLASVPLAFAGPIDGAKWLERRVEASSKMELLKTFAAGERACVIAIGDHKPVVNLTITVYDEQERIVAQDQGAGEAGDFVAAIWYPPREASYRIVIANPGVEYNKIAVSIK